MSVSRRKKAILIVGPTGSGKTPLGNYLANTPVPPFDFIHLDFGEQIRRVTRGEIEAGLNEAEVEFLRKLLASGALLEQETFFLAEKIINHFILTHPPKSPTSIYILNGIPRHHKQALALDPIFRILALIVLEASAEVIFHRLKLDPASDRQGRTDDSPELVSRKLEIFRQRTQPLLEHYQSLKIPILRVPVEADTLPEHIFRTIRHNLQSSLGDRSPSA